MRRLLIVHRQGSGERESEPIVVDTDDPRLLAIELDDGERLEIDPRELRSATRATHDGELSAIEDADSNPGSGTTVRP